MLCSVYINSIFVASGSILASATLLVLFYAGSPSEEKLQRGDEILSVDGHLAGDLTHTELVDLIRKAGKNRTVALVVKRKGEYTY